LVLYTKTGMGDGQQANNPGYKSFRSYQEFLGIIWLFLMLMQRNWMSNEIVANGGLNGSYATITTKDGLN
jgi:molybdopterin-containing oxidoreductase family iron-sulfur binding subunit